MKSRRFVAFSSFMAVYIAGGSVHAASGAWNVNNAGTWATATNWLSSTIPGATSGTTNADVATFGYTLTADRIVTVDSNRNIGGITFSGTAAYKYTLSGGNLLLTNGGVIQTTSGNGNHTDTISTAIAIQGDGGAASFTAGATSTTSLLSIGAVTGVSTGTNVTTLTLNGSNTGTNVVTGIIGNGAGGGKLAITKSGAGTWKLSGANTFTGGVSLSGGKLILGSTTALGAAAGTLTIAGSTTLDSSVANLVMANNNPVTVNGDFTFTGTQNLNLGTGAFSLGAAAGTTRTITSSTIGNTLTLGGIIANGTTATGLIKAGAGNLALSGANTYSGGTTVSAGALFFLNTAAQPATGTTTVAAGATLGLGVGGTGYFSSANVDSLFANSLARVTLNAASLVGIDTTAGDFAYSTPQSARGFNKLGANTLTLSGANSYTGTTIISGGTLKAGIASVAGVSGAFGLNSAVTLANTSGATLDITGYNTQIGSLTGGGTSGGNVTLGAATLTVGGDNTSPAAFAGVINGSGGNITKIGSGTLTLSNTGQVVSNNSTIDVTAGSLVFNTNGATANLFTGTGDVVKVETGGALSMVQNYSGSYVSANNWTFGSKVILNGGTFTAGSTNGALFERVTSGTAVEVDAASTISLSSGNYTQDATIEGTLTGTGNLALNRANSNVKYLNLKGDMSGYSGNVTIGTSTATGYVVFGNATGWGSGTLALTGSGSNVLLGDEAATAYNASWTGGSALSFVSGTLAPAGAVTIGAGATLQVMNNSASNAILFSPAGGLTINGGTLSARGTAGTSAVVPAAGSTWVFGGSALSTVSANMQLNNAGATMQVADAVAGSGVDATITGTISGSNGFTKTGAGTLTLAAANSFTGNLTVNAGTLAADVSDSAFGVTSNSITVNSGGTVASNGARTIANSVTLNSGATLANIGSGEGIWNGTITTSGSITVNPAGQTITLSGTVGGTGTITVPCAGGTLNLSGTNSFNGGLLMTSATSPGTATTVDLPTTSSLSVTTGKSILIGNNSASGATATQTFNVAGAVTNDGSLYVGRSGVLNVNNGAAWTQNGDMSVAGQGGYNAAMNVAAGAAFTYAGSSTIKINPGSSGIANLNIDGSFTTSQGFETNATGGATYKVTLENGGTLRMSADVADLTNGATNKTQLALGTGGGIIDTNGHNAGLSTGITGTSLTKTGAGTLTLTGANTYTGTTTVNYGTLLVNGANTGTGAVSVASGATLGGGGSIAGAVNVSGTLAPGASIGPLATGSLTFNNGANFAYEMDSGAAPAVAGDFQQVFGDLALTGTVNLNLTDLASSPSAFAPGTTLTLINYAGTWNGGFFTYGTNELANGESFTAGLTGWTINYNAISGGLNFASESTGGSFVTLTAVPEPGSWIALGCLLGSGTLLRRRLKK